MKNQTLILHLIIWMGLGILSNSCTSDTLDKENLDLDKTEITPIDPVEQYKKDQIASVNQGMAIIAWQKQFSKSPDDRQRRQLSEMLAKWKDSEKAADYVKKAKVEFALGQVFPAEASLRSALRLDPKNEEAHIELVSVLLKRKDIPRAFEMLRNLKAILNNTPRISPDLILRYRYLLAIAYTSNGERDKSHNILTDLIEQNPTFTPAYTALAASYLASERWEMGEFVIKRGLDKFDKDPSLLNLMGSVTAQRGDSQGARDYFSKALSIDPNHVSALINRASIAAKIGELQAAELDLEAAIKIDQSQAQARYLMGEVYNRTGRVKSAETEYLAALQLNPELATARFRIAQLYSEKIKNPTEALRYFSEVIQLPDADERLKQEARLELEKFRENAP